MDKNVSSNPVETSCKQPDRFGRKSAEDFSRSRRGEASHWLKFVSDVTLLTFKRFPAPDVTDLLYVQLSFKLRSAFCGCGCMGKSQVKSDSLANHVPLWLFSANQRPELS